MADLSYCGDIMERAKAVVLPSDLKDALEYFKKKTGKDVTRVEVSEKVIPILQDIMPEGIELLPHGGVLTFEIWMTALPKPFSPEVIEKEVVVTPTESSDKPQDDILAPFTPSILPKRPVTHKNTYETTVPVLHKSPVKVKKIKKPVRHDIMGRPPKVGIVSRTTLWRRAKKIKKTGERLL